MEQLILVNIENTKTVFKLRGATIPTPFEIFNAIQESNTENQSDYRESIINLLRTTLNVDVECVDLYAEYNF